MHQKSSSGSEYELKFRDSSIPKELSNSSPQIGKQSNASDDSINLKDAGNLPNDHYKSKLSPIRYKFREFLLPIIRYETNILYNLQTKIRNPIFDFYFAWTANLASHTFYVLMLPPPLWFGASQLSRDLIYVLGLGIYFTGFLKDYFCLPRPRSPPLHRITMSSYTTQEYGFPSSHSANATAVTLVLLSRVYKYGDSLTTSTYYSLIIGLTIYYFSLIFGRLYCGMHGFLDIFIGSSVGGALFLFRHYYGIVWDNFIFNQGLILGSLLILVLFIGLIHFHSEPVDDCPCFDDSVAFIGVLIGLDLSHLVAFHTKFYLQFNDINDLYLIPFENKGIVMLTIRFLVGVTLVVIWKSLSKPIIFTILPPIYKFIGIYLPRRNFISTAHTDSSIGRIRATSISNDVSQIGDLNNFLKGVTDHNRIDNIGPSSEIDYYEILDYNNKNKNGSSYDLDKLNFKSGVFKYRYDVEIVGRLIVYAGVSITTIWTFTFVSMYLIEI
ncbi:unnamed protein product [Candida verbasci]|uniref:Phosphatidic acid phosphatase type 2/haloperoxidase domain-containing protein n=1 Tax=Candida verbasci TaxID=1227364 RepID=A0A9W4TVH7_9ASCO|nr:unnamed protein product [Candida verbasci]